MELCGGSSLLQKDAEGKGLDEQSQSLSSLDGKVVAIYFMHPDNPKCSQFTERLIDVYNELKAAGKAKPFEVVVLLSSVSQMKAWQSNQPWSAILCQPSHRRGLEINYGVFSTPSLLVLNPDGSLSSRNAVKAVREHGASAYPWKGMEDDFEKPESWLDVKRMLVIGMVICMAIYTLLRYTGYGKKVFGIDFEDAEL